jgi:hypothetical protein
MQIKNKLIVVLRILVVCLLFTVCMGVGVALSGLSRVASPGSASQPTASQASSQVAPAAQAATQTSPATQPAPGVVFAPLLIFSLCVGIVASYLILRSSWHGWALAGAMFMGMYGISTVVNAIEAMFFLSNKVPHGMIRALFIQGAIAMALFVPLALLVLGKWRDAKPAVALPTPAHMRASSVAWKLALLVIAFVFLYMFFGYFVAWRNPELRRYYAGPDWPTFFAAMKGNWQNSRWIFPLASFRALLFVAFMYPLIRMLRAGRWESAIATALFLASWTTSLLLPNPLMPASVARSHFWETLAFSLVFGSLLGWLLSAPPREISQPATAAT